jgi:hypothetical protein
MDFSTRGFLRMARKHNVKLNPGWTFSDHGPCVVGLAIMDLGLPHDINSRDDLPTKLGKRNHEKLQYIERGFENASSRHSRVWDATEGVLNPRDAGRYFKLGQRLREKVLS